MKLNYQIILQELGETIVAVIKDNETQQVVHAYKMNETGAFIINQINAGLDETTIVKRMSEEFTVSSDLAEQEVHEFIDMLKNKGIIAGE
ncbi:MAG: PqqD family protein [Prevotella sp.]|nr:PqqD family protein [Prevotella sp.]